MADLKSVQEILNAVLSSSGTSLRTSGAGGGSGGTTALSGLTTDVAISAPTTGSTLKYNGSTWQNVNLGFYSQPMVNPIQKSVITANISSGYTDLYTVPANRIGIVQGFVAQNTTANPFSLFTAYKSGATYYRSVGTATTVNASAQGNINPTGVQVLFPGDIFAVYAASAGTNIFGNIIECSSSTLISSARLLALTSSQNLLYTCPSGYYANILTGGFPGFGNVAGYIVGCSSGALDVSMNQVVAGSSAYWGNRIKGSASLAADAATNFSLVNLSAGDSIYISCTSSVTAHAWVNVTLFPS